MTAPHAFGGAELRRRTRYELGGVDLRAAATFGRIWTLEAALPLRMLRQATTFLDPGGDPVEGVVGPEFVDDTLGGVGDLGLAARMRAVGDRGGDWIVDIRFGLLLPTGTAALRRGERRPEDHAPQLFGNGSVDPQLSIEAVRFAGAYRWTGWASARVPVFRGHEGEAGPIMAAAGVGGDRSLGSETFRLALGVAVNRDPVSLGVAGTVGAFFLPRRDVQLQLGVDIPLWNDGDDALVEQSLGLRFGISGQVPAPWR